MARYVVGLSPLPGPSIPPLLQLFGDWLAAQEYGAVGWFSLQTEPVPSEWNPALASRLQRDGFAFLQMPDGSLLVLLKTGTNAPPAVVLLGSEGETDTVAASLEEFLQLLSRAETGLADLDEGGADSRSALREWLANNPVSAPIALPFDFDVYLDGGSNAVSQQAIAPNPGAADPGPGTLLQTILQLVGRRADDPAVEDFVTRVLEKKVPNSTTDASHIKYVTAPKHGIEMGFSHKIRNEKYPLLKKSKSSYIPYLHIAWLTKDFAEPLPFGLGIGMSPEEITSRIGAAPREVGTGRRQAWMHMLDAARDVCLSVDRKSISIQVDEAQELSSPHGVPSRPVVGLFVAWAIQRGLLNESRLVEHAELITAIHRRERRGSDLVEGALARGLWDVHLKDEPGLRSFALCWFHNTGGAFIRDDLVGVFGGRKGPYGHLEPALDEDDWASVDRATAVFDARFAAWIKTSP